MFPFFSVIDDTDDDENETETTTQNNSGNLFRENHPYVATFNNLHCYTRLLISIFSQLDTLSGYCQALGGEDIKGGSANWNGNEWNVALKADEYNIDDMESCMNVACLPYDECVGVSWHATPFCYVWDTCDFDNLQGNSQWTTMKKIGTFNQTL